MSDEMPQIPRMPEAPKKKMPSWLPWVVAGLFALTTLVAVTTNGEGSAHAAPSPASPTPSLSYEVPSPTVAPEPTEDPEPVYTNVTKSDVDLKLKTTSKQCFGSAGCLEDVEVQLVLHMTDAEIDALQHSATWDVTYKINGDESGPVIGTFSVYGNGKYDVNEESLSTCCSSNAPVSIQVLSVERY